MKTQAETPAGAADSGRSWIRAFLSLLSLPFRWAAGFARSTRQIAPDERRREPNPRGNNTVEIRPDPGTIDPPPSRSRPAVDGTTRTGETKIERPRREKPDLQNRSLEIQPAPGTTEPPPPGQ